MSAQNSEAIIDVLTNRVKELESSNADLLSLREEVKGLKEEFKSSKEINKSMQKVCAYHT